MHNVTSIGALYAVPLLSACPGCGLHSWCLPANLNGQEAGEIERVTRHQLSTKRDCHVFHAGDTLNLLYIVSSGSLKTSITDMDGRVQITGFSLPGELVGIEAIDSGKYPCNVTALEDSSCCAIRYADLDCLGQRMPALQHHIHRAMSREINRDYGLMIMLGSMSADERIAHFLLNLSMRHAANGYSPLHFRLCMSRRDIGSYLGLKLETISRVMSRLTDRQILDVAGKDIKVRSLDGLRQIIGNLDKRRLLPGTQKTAVTIRH